MDRIEKIDATVKKRNEDLAALSEEMKVLPQQIQETQARADAAIANNDYSVYSDAIAERDKLQFKLDYIKSRANMLKSTPAIDIDEAKTAWNAYRKDYDLKLKKKLTEYKSAIEKALAMYGELVAMQTESAKIRSRFCDYTRLENSKAVVVFPSEMIPLRAMGEQHPNGIGLPSLFGCKTRDPDAVHYMSNYLITHKVPGVDAVLADDEQMKIINSVLTTGCMPNPRP